MVSVDATISSIKQSKPMKFFLVIYVLIVIAFILLMYWVPSAVGVTISEGTKIFFSVLSTLTVAALLTIMYASLTAPPEAN
jgi:hypothetical protein